MYWAAAKPWLVSKEHCCTQNTDRVLPSHDPSSKLMWQVMNIQVVVCSTALGSEGTLRIKVFPGALTVSEERTWLWAPILQWQAVVVSLALRRELCSSKSLSRPSWFCRSHWLQIYEAPIGIFNISFVLLSRSTVERGFIGGFHRRGRSSEHADVVLPPVNEFMRTRVFRLKCIQNDHKRICHTVEPALGLCEDDALCISLGAAQSGDETPQNNVSPSGVLSFAMKPQKTWRNFNHSDLLLNCVSCFTASAAWLNVTRQTREIR